MTSQPDTRTRNLRAATKGALIAEIRRLEEQAVQAEVELADATVAYERGQARAFQAEAELAALIAERDGWRERAEQAEAALREIDWIICNQDRKRAIDKLARIQRVERAALSAGDNQ